MKKIISVAALAVLGLSSVSAHAVDLTAAVGQSSESTMVYRLGAQWNWDQRWWESDTGHLSGYWDLGYTYWDGDDSSSNHTLSFAPVFVYEFAGQSVRPYIEAGIGVAGFANTEVEGNKLGTAFQFEDRLGVGLRFSGQEVGLRAVHYSNAGISSTNDGIEAYTVHYRMSF